MIDQSVELHSHERAPLISVLQDINIEFGYMPADGTEVCKHETEGAPGRVYHVATFYTAFSLTPRGEHTIKVCMGTACHVRGAPRVLDALEQRLEIKAGDTTGDLKFTLETVNCLGACAMGPVLLVDGEYRTVSPGEVNHLIDSLLEAAGCG